VQERLQKILARSGVASRRAAEAYVTAGRVRVNGRIVTELGTKADPRNDRIEVDGRRLVMERHAYYVLHKPRGMVTTLHDPEGRATIATLLKGLPERVFPVGRLDFHTSGTLLLTNDGRFSESLLRPTRAVPKTYVAKVSGHLDERTLEKLREGVELDDGYVTRPADLHVLRREDRTTWIEVTLTEGKNRQIHRMMEVVGRRVMRLVRTGFAGVGHEGLRPGELRLLEAREIEKLREQWVIPGPRPKTGRAGSAPDDET
jgi:23S rRNA pseudouridine2605 synthase